METKSRIRKRIGRLTAALDPRIRTELSDRMIAVVEASPQFRRAHTVALFHPLPDEPDILPLAERWKDRKRILLPCVEGDEMVFRTYSGAAVRGRFSVMEPSEGEAVPPAEVELIVVPGVAFDRRGNRLGRGKGYYDRCLARSDAYKTGVCFPHQLLDHVPVEPHDIPVDSVITSSCSRCRDDEENQVTEHYR